MRIRKFTPHTGDRERISGIARHHRQDSAVYNRPRARWRENTERLKSVSGEDMIDSNRLLQEAALMADKLTFLKKSAE
jgi:hypothetical protein